MKNPQTGIDVFAKSHDIFSRCHICKQGCLHWIGNVKSYSEHFGSQNSKHYFETYGQNGLTDTCWHFACHFHSIFQNVVFQVGCG